MLAAGALVGFFGHSHQAAPWNLGQRVAALSGGSIADEDEALAARVERPATEEDLRVSAEMVAVLDEELKAGALTFRDLMHAVPRLAALLREPQHEAVRLLLRGRYSADEAELAFNYLVALSTNSDAAMHALEELGAKSDTAPLTQYAIGRVLFRRQHYAAAFAAFYREGQRSDAVESRYLALRSLLEAKDYTAVTRLQDDPAYRALFTPAIQLQVAIGKRDWREIAVRSPLLQLQTFYPQILAMTLLVAGAWLFFFLHLAEAPRLWSWTAGLCLFGLVLGILSTVPTVYAVIWQDDMLGFEPGNETVRTILYYIGGVGLREEVCKLLLFCPLVPFVLRRDDEFEALMVASFVGLGFAIEENGSYFMLSEFTAAPGRFLTANFLHAALTGLNGLALVRALACGGSAWSGFLVTLPGTIIAHGLYDAGMAIPQVDDTGTITMVMFVGCTWYYFNQVARLRHDVRTTVSLSGSYVVAISVVAAAMLAFQMLNLGPKAGFSIAARELISSAILVYVFLREFREPLTA